MKKVNIKNSIQNKLINSLELPTSIVLNVPFITFIGKNKISIENFKVILKYSLTEIKLSTNCGILKINGENLHIKEFSKEKINIIGNILNVEYI